MRHHRHSRSRFAFLLSISGLVSSAACTAELTTESPILAQEDLCLQAEASQRACGAEVAPDFVEACMASSEPGHLESVEALAALDCTYDDELADATNGPFIGACTATVLSARLLTLGRNWSRSTGLSEERREALRPYYGDLVDKVRMHWGATFVNEWWVLGQELRLGMEVGGQTYGRDIFIARPRDRSSEAQTVLISHELRHSYQAQSLGGVAGFAFGYCRAFFRSGFSYRDNDYEVDARDAADRFRACTDEEAQCR